MYHEVEFLKHLVREKNVCYTSNPISLLRLNKKACPNLRQKNNSSKSRKECTTVFMKEILHAQSAIILSAMVQQNWSQQIICPHSFLLASAGRNLFSIFASNTCAAIRRFKQLKAGKLPTFSIVNGNWVGVVSSRSCKLVIRVKK